MSYTSDNFAINASVVNMFYYIYYITILYYIYCIVWYNIL